MLPHEAGCPSTVNVTAPVGAPTPATPTRVAVRVTGVARVAFEAGAAASWTAGVTWPTVTSDWVLTAASWSEPEWSASIVGWPPDGPVTGPSGAVPSEATDTGEPESAPSPSHWTVPPLTGPPLAVTVAVNVTS